MKRLHKLSMALLPAALISVGALAKPASLNPTVPYGNGTWVYDATQYDPTTGKASDPQAGFFLKQLQSYNDGTKTSPISQVFAYGGDIEAYCNSGQGKNPEICLPKSFLLSYYPTFDFNKSTNTWDFWTKSLGDSGFRSVADYKRLTYYNPTVGKSEPVQIMVDIDGRVDMPADESYLNDLNRLSPQDAHRFADVVAKGICADDNIDGVQFDIEPFSFTGENGTVQGPGQKYFYEEIAKDFAGYYNDDPTKDPLHCVDTAHPNGRIFSVFTFAARVTPEVEQVFNKYHNGYVVDSLYDLGTDKDPAHPTWHSVYTFTNLVEAEIKAMATKNIPYQFAIPASASVHEYESSNLDDKGIWAGNQWQYVQAALNEIKKYGITPNFKGIDVWSYNAKMYWHGYQFFPAQPEGQTITTLQNGLGWNPLGSN